MNAVTPKFVLAGQATFTVTPPEAARDAGYAPHYTYRVERVELPAKGQWPASVKWFVSTLTGADNTRDYVYTGMLDAKTGALKLTAKSAFPETCKRVAVLRRVLARVWAGELAAVAATGWTVDHAGCCGRCGRLLTVPASVRSGFGPECIQYALGCTLAQWVAANPEPAAEPAAPAVEPEPAVEPAAPEYGDPVAEDLCVFSC